MPAKQSNIIGDFVSLFYPQICPGCGFQLGFGEKWVCLKCLIELPVTSYASTTDNPVYRLLSQRIPVSAAAACYRFIPTGRFANIMHAYKYKGEKHLSEFFAQQACQIAVTHEIITSSEVVIPVPLHPAKEKARGYNQSALVAEKIAMVSEKEVQTDNLKRIKNTVSQTRFDREGRLQNVMGAFLLERPEILNGKRILMLDDVLTTGSTIEACAEVLIHECKNIELSVLTLAKAN